MAEPLIQIERVSFKHNEQTVLKDVSLSVEKGEMVYLIGKTGSGKSSLLKLLYADHPVQEGKITFGGTELHGLKRRKIPALRRRLGVVFQDFQLLPDRTVGGNLEFAMKATGWKKKEKIQSRIKDILTLVGLEGKDNKYPHQLSGGEQQRVSIARALINNPEMIIADEPTGNLDPATTLSIMELLNEIKNDGTTVIMATHDYSVIEKFPGRVLYFYEGELKEDEKPTV